MARRSGRGVWVISCAMLVACLAWVGQANAGPKDFNQLLRGDYAFSGEATCLVSSGGFNTNLTPVGPPVPFPHVESFSVQGVRTFKGDGTGSVVVRVVNISHPFAVPSPVVVPYTPFFNRGGVGTADVEATFNYEVAPDLTFTVETLTLTGSIDRGTRAGQTFTVTNFPQFTGRISQDHRTLTVAHVLLDSEPAVETHTFSNGDVDKRICHRSRILLEQKGGQ